MDYPFLTHSGEFGQFIRNTDWSKTSFGDPSGWPDSLTSAVSIVLSSGFPIAIYWGEDFSLIYNEAWSAIPGQKHPWALGKPGATVWPEIWDGLKEEFETVLHDGRSYRRQDAPLYMRRFGYTEECCFDYTLSPVRASDGTVGGVFNAVIETTFKCLQERRNKLLTTLMDIKYLSHYFDEAVTRIQSLLSEAQADIPFFALYTQQENGDHKLTASAGLSTSNLHAAAALDASQIIESGDLTDTTRLFPEPVCVYWPEPVTEALFVPIAKGEARLKGYILLGLSARKRIDEQYRGFLTAVGLHTGTILNNALNYELREAFNREHELNEELAASNEELRQTQEQLSEINTELEERIRKRTADVAEERDKLRRFFMQAPAGVCILSGPDLVFELVNPPYQQLLPGRKLLGRPIFEAVPEITNEPIADIIRNVYNTGQGYEGKEVPIPLIGADGTVTDRYFNFSYQPRFSDNGKTEGIMVFCYEVTDLVESRKLSQKNERDLSALVMTSHYPLMILRGPDFVIDICNERLAEMWNKPQTAILGRKLLDVLPELADQPFPVLLREVYNTGIPYGQEEETFYIETPEGRETKYISFYYDPLKDEQGNVNGIIVAAADITGMVRSRHLLEESNEEQQSLNEEITASNEELASANDELQATNEELSATQFALEQTLSSLAVSEARFRSLIQDAPVAIAVLRGRELIIEAANTSVLKLWGKSAAIIGKKLADALPELSSQPYLQLLDNVLVTEKPYQRDEARAFLEHDGKLQELFFNFVYQPLHSDGHTDAIMVVAIDVTPQVKARRELERAQDSLKLAFNAAELGSFDMDLEKGTMIWDKRCRTLFGINHDREVNYETDFVNGLHPDDRKRITGIISKVFDKAASNGEYDVEYRTVSAEDQKVRWVRAKGKAYFNEADKPVRFVGAVLDITEQKLDEIRKNDFIGMVSHELKTPLTSLTAYPQILLPKARKQSDPFMTEALNKANVQAQRMTAMINGFLNISRLESGKIHLDKQPFLLNQLLTDMMEDMRLLNSSHVLQLDTCPPVMVTADQDKIGSVVTNLLSNAIKYSPKGYLIEVRCQIIGNEVKVSVKDEGIGIKPEDQARLFQRYYRVENMVIKHVAGFGIGLYLSAEIIERHHGRIGVESTYGKGSTFWFTLPVNS